LGADSAVVDGGGKNDAVGFCEQFIELLYVVLVGACFVLEAKIAVSAKLHPFPTDCPQLSFKTLRRKQL
jgi:hypothetical protein